MKPFIVCGLLPFCFVLTTGCAYQETKVDQHFGEATRATMNRQVINPKAGQQSSSVTALDGRSAKEVIFNYYESYNTPQSNSNSQSFDVGNGGGMSGNGN